MGGVGEEGVITGFLFAYSSSIYWSYCDDNHTHQGQITGSLLDYFNLLLKKKGFEMISSTCAEWVHDQGGDFGMSLSGQLTDTGVILPQ